jgi:hypothetical protein
MNEERILFKIHLRDQFALQAMTILEPPLGDSAHRTFAEKAYRIADAMMEQKKWSKEHEPTRQN